MLPDSDAEAKRNKSTAYLRVVACSLNIGSLYSLSDIICNQLILS